MKVVKILFGLIGICWYSAVAQRSLDDHQLRIDEIDGEINHFINDSSFSYIVFPLLDSIQAEAKTENLQLADLNVLEKALANDIIPINETTIKKIFIKPEKYFALAGFIHEEIQGKGVQFLLKNPIQSFEIIQYIYLLKSTEIFLKNEVISNPENVIRYYSSYQKAPYAIELLESAIFQNPLSAKTYLASNNPIKEAVYKNNSNLDSLLLTIYKEAGLKSKAYILIDAIAQNKLTIEEANSLPAENEALYFKALIEISKNQQAIGRKALDDELSYLSIRKIRPINSQYEDHNSAKRFAPFKQYSAEELYTLLIYSQEEIFTSTFSGAYPILVNKLKTDSINGYQLLENMNFNEFRSFIKLLAGYGFLENYLKLMPEKDKITLFSRLLNLESSFNLLKEAVSVADALGSIEDSTTLILIENNLYNNYHSIDSGELKVAYALLLKLFADKAQIHQVSIDSIAALYPGKSLTEMDSFALFGKDSLHTQLHFFYDDDDGLASYNSFISFYKNSAWKITDLTDFVLIKSVKGKKVQILANKPTYERTAPNKMMAYINKRAQDVEVLVHRGHSFYVSNTLHYLSPDLNLVVLGSCGGYHQVLEILEKAPETQIIATKQIGSFAVNDPLIYQLVNQINKGDLIQWEDFWNKLAKKFPKESYGYDKFIEYVPPHKNLGAGFIQAFKEYQFAN